MPDPANAASPWRRPHRNLLKYYIFRSLLLGPLFPAALLPAVLRYSTLRYRFDTDGVTVQWGALLRREIRLNYTRIQDIQVVSNAVERWLGLARVELQTAAGSAKAEIRIEGLKDFQQIRDGLYTRLRRKPDTEPDLATILKRVAQELRGLRRELNAHRARGEGVED